MVYDNFFKNVFTKTYDNPNLEIYIDKPLGQLPLKADIIIKIPNNLLGTLPVPLLSNLFSTNNILILSIFLELFAFLVKFCFVFLEFFVKVFLDPKTEKKRAF